MLATDADGITTAQSGIEQHREPYSLPGTEWPTCFVGGHILLGPNRKTGTGFQRRIFDARCRVGSDKAGLLRPRKQPAHGIDKMPRLEWRLGTAVATGGNHGLRDLPIAGRTGGSDDLLEN